MESAVLMQGITKTFPGVVANDNVDLEVYPGEIHALVGENGAGKSTLMNVLYGMYKADSGAIYVNGELTHIRDNNDAIAAGIGMVHQSFKLIPSFTVAENITLGAEPRRGIFVDIGEVRQSSIEISRRYGLDVDPDARVRDLPVGVQQRVEILKALYRNADILILDEPTAVLTPQETLDLFGVIRSLVKNGKTVIFITHKLREVMDISDRVTVMRSGRVVATKNTKDTNPTEIARLMVGRDVLLRVEKPPAVPREVCLEIENLVVRDNRDLIAVRNLSLTVRAGEILGIAGVEGNGQTELVEALIGIRPIASGCVRIKGKAVTGVSVRDRRRAGLGCVPEDRVVQGLALTASIEENLMGVTYYEPPYQKSGLLDFSKVGELTQRLIAEYDVRTADRHAAASTLSGGNMQKVVLAREIDCHPDVLVVAQPTRGLDIGSIEFVHSRIVEARDGGAAVLLVSAELSEVMSLSDRIAVIYEGEIVGTTDAAVATEQTLGLWMAGLRPDSDDFEKHGKGDAL